MTTEIRRDAWGIPHLRADSALQLARLQGRVTAHDRAWQIETERHRARGTSAAFLGAGELSWDVLVRRARLDDTARRCYVELERRDPETAAWVRAYTDGVNDGLAEGARRAPEFARVGLAPGRWEPWTPLGVWLSTHLLFAGFPAKLWRERALRHLGPDAVALFATDGPGTAGSNGWLLSGARTDTGLPLLAGDPHRYIEDPGVYQQIRLACPEFDVVGLAVPGVPGIAHFGHTGTVAWSITNAMADYQDLYREHLRRTGAGIEALGPDGHWERAERYVETIHVAGEAPVEIEVVETARGPVIAGGPEGLDGVVSHGAPPAPPTALALRHPPRVTDDLGFGSLLPLLRARRVEDVDKAFDRWAEPVNVVQAADTEGGLLHRVAGRVPVRSEANRLRPVAAWEPGHEWRGWHTMPYGTVEDGAAVMANQRGPAAPLGVEFSPPHRARRIRELLDARTTWSGAGLATLHTDTRLASAAPLLDRIGPLDGLSPAAARLRAQLLAWDRHMDADSSDAAAYAAVRSAVVRRLAAHPAFAALTEPSGLPEVLLPWLALTPRVGFALEHLLRAEELYGIDRDGVVREAVEEVAAAPPGGVWGDTHRLAAWRALPPASEESSDEPGLGGDHDCVLCASAVPGVTDRAARGPAARFVWDLARREDSLWVVPFGADGVPGAAHHRDQLPLWVRGDLVPVGTDRDLLVPDVTLPAETEPEIPVTTTPVHEQHIEGFGVVRVRPVEPERDADTLYGWVRDERAAFWGMNGLDRDQVAEIYAHMAALDTHHAHLVSLDGVPVALLQTYDPAADRVGECYPVRDGDIGVHLLVAPAGAAGAASGWTGTLLRALTVYVLRVLDGRRVVVDPDVRNTKALARFERQGFEQGPAVVLPEVDLPDVYLPEKHARLAFLARETVFPEERAG
ncbi:GNAT family N-acetyltransferase [Streptomyces sp. J2-1]|uniref:GNAT family N-acetyltransferase n=1 Tax=Streptomyces corallincola TaxID=2851888 RepID=UPI001C38452E|nr:GNAT family N-acetyltransferase [Streptomyces corallincola]MBV2356903.1 GNAT family N-acetyltransferase [Streptomyces corallincola]